MIVCYGQLLLVVLLVFLLGAITNKGGAMGIIANVVAGLIGSSVGQALFGTWGPSFAGMSLIPSVLGAVIVVAVVSFFFEIGISPVFVTVDTYIVKVILYERSS